MIVSHTAPPEREIAWPAELASSGRSVLTSSSSSSATRLFGGPEPSKRSSASSSPAAAAAAASATSSTLSRTGLSPELVQQHLRTLPDVDSFLLPFESAKHVRPRDQAALVSGAYRLLDGEITNPALLAALGWQDQSLSCVALVRQLLAFAQLWHREVPSRNTNAMTPARSAASAASNTVAAAAASAAASTELAPAASHPGSTGSSGSALAPVPLAPLIQNIENGVSELYRRLEIGLAHSDLKIADENARVVQTMLFQVPWLFFPAAYQFLPSTRMAYTCTLAAEPYLFTVPVPIASAYPKLLTLLNVPREFRVDNLSQVLVSIDAEQVRMFFI